MRYIDTSKLLPKVYLLRKNDHSSCTHRFQNQIEKLYCFSSTDMISAAVVESTQPGVRRACLPEKKQGTIESYH